MPATTWTHAAIMEQLPAIIADCLGVDEADVQPETNFWSDLGGESIDDLDLSFRCERAFGVKSPFQSLTQLATAPLDDEGYISDEALQAFLAKFPGLAQAMAKTGESRFRPADLRRFYTTEQIASFVLAAVPK
jgi:acyl carrier protein